MDFMWCLSNCDILIPQTAWEQLVPPLWKLVWYRPAGTLLSVTEMQKLWSYIVIVDAEILKKK